MCGSNTNYLLKDSLEEQTLADTICSRLNDTQLENLFTLISSQMDFNIVRDQIRNEVYNDFAFLIQIARVTLAVRTFQEVFYF